MFSCRSDLKMLENIYLMVIILSAILMAQIVNGTNTTTRYDEQQASERIQSVALEFLIPSLLSMSMEPSQNTNETVLFPIQPEFQILTVDGDLCTNLGYQQSWLIEATLNVSAGHPDAVLLGTARIPFQNGTANFTDLSISHAGTGYVITYTIVSPQPNQITSLPPTSTHNVAERELEFQFTYDISSVYETSAINPQPKVTVLDKVDGSQVATGWRNRTWTLTAELYKDNILLPQGHYGSNITTITNGIGIFNNLGVLEQGSNHEFKFSVNTTPPSSYSAIKWTLQFEVRERQFEVALVQDIGDCNETVVCGQQPVLQIQNKHDQSDATHLDGVWTVAVSVVKIVTGFQWGSELNGCLLPYGNIQEVVHSLAECKTRCESLANAPVKPCKSIDFKDAFFFTAFKCVTQYLDSNSAKYTSPCGSIDGYHHTDLMEIYETPDTQLSGTTVLQINNLTGRVEYTDLAFSKEYLSNLQLHFAVTVVPADGSRYDNIEITSSQFNVSRQLYCLQEVLPNISPQEAVPFTQSAKLHIIDCATGQVALPNNSIVVTMATTDPSLAEALDVPTATSNGSVVQFDPSRTTYYRWAVNLTVTYSSPDIHHNLISSPFNVPITNDHSPSIMGAWANNVIRVNENQALSELFTFMDADTPGVSGKYGGFTVEPDLGLVNFTEVDVSNSSFVLASPPMDYETVQQITFNLTVRDNAPHPFERSTTYKIVINITDVDDVCPILAQNITSEMITIFENETFVLNYTLVDPDTSRANLSVFEATQLTNHSAITVNYGLDNITGNFHINALDTKEAIFLLAFNLNDTTCTNLTHHQVILRVISLNEFPPVFTTGNTTLFISEDTQVPFTNSSLQFTATDADNTSTDGRVRYFFKSGNESGHFHLDQDNGTLTIVKPLDYETQTQFLLNIVAMDSPTEGEPFQAEILVTINVLNLDDTCPKFVPNITSEMITIFENETFVLNYTLVDPDTNRADLSVIEATQLTNHSAITVNYGLDNITGEFHINALDIKEATFLLAFNLTDPTCTNPAQHQLILHVISLNEFPPVFTSGNTTLFISEDTQVPFSNSSLQFTATDADNTSTDGRVRYFFKSGNESGHFHLDQDNGTMTIVKPLDYETQQQFLLNIVAMDSPTESEPFQAEIFVTINVLNLDDTCPKFVPNITSEMITIFENETFVLNYTLVDPDTSRADLSVIEATQLTNHSAITVNYGLDNITGVFNIDSLDTDEEVFLLAFNITDGTCTYKTFKIPLRVLSVNEFPTILSSNSTINMTICEDLSVPFTNATFQFNATDADGGPSGRVRYLIESGNENGNFHLDQDNGTLTIVKALDYETRTQHIVNIVAMDSPTRDEPYEDKKQLIINVCNINEHDPVFPIPSYTFTVVDDYPIGLPLGQIQTSDNDAEDCVTYGWNSTTGFEDYFTLDTNTGQIILAKLLDFGSQLLRLKVNATDCLSPPRQTFADVNIIVEDAYVEDIKHHELCLRAINTRRLEYDASDLTWSENFENTSQAMAEEFLLNNATGPLNVSQCYLAYVMTSTQAVHCEDALDYWFVDGDLSNSSAQQLIWKQAAIFGVGLVTRPSHSDPLINVTYVVAKFDSCVEPSTASQNVGAKKDLNDVLITVDPPKRESDHQCSLEIQPPKFNASIIANLTGVTYKYFIKKLSRYDATSVPSKNPSLYTDQQLKSNADGIWQCGESSNPNTFGKPFTCGTSCAGARKRRDIQDITIQPLESGAAYVTFVIVYLNGDTAIVTSWMTPQTTQPPDGEGFCLRPKTCECLNVAEINSTTQLVTDASYAGVNTSAVNTSLTYIQTWDQQKIALMCKEAKCDESALTDAITQIANNVTEIDGWLTAIDSSKVNLQKVIDCVHNRGVRSDIFEHYMALCERKVIMSNVKSDLLIKKTILEKENQRCKDRSWLREVLENVWHH